MLAAQSQYMRLMNKRSRQRPLALQTEFDFESKSRRTKLGNQLKLNQIRRNVPKKETTARKRLFLFDILVEAAGIEPASASTPPQALHVYPALLI